MSRLFSYLGFIWQKCHHCRAILKVLTEKEYTGLNPGYDPGEYFDSRDKEEVKERLGVDAKKNLILKYIGQEKSPVGLSLLDIGCGMGGFLLAGQELGMEVLGIDPSRDHSRVAKEIFGLPVLNDYFTVTGIALRKFDLMPREKSFLKLPCAVKVVRCSK